MPATDSPLPPDAIDAIISHMNDDHAEAVLGYVHRFGAVPAADAARLVSMDSTHMLIHATVGGTAQTIEIAFDHTLRDAKDARDTLISMARPEKT